VNIGTQFELDLAKELGLNRVPGSGNQWYAKLDVSGKGTRWSLKATGKKGFRVDDEFVEEAVAGLQHDEVPMWAVRIEEVGDFVMMRKEDWIRERKEKTFTIPATKAEERRSRAKVPQLMREANDN
jgi:hypothetical protein